MNVGIIAESKKFEKFITICIIANAITLGLETSQTIMNYSFTKLLLTYTDKIFILIFTFEAIIKIKNNKFDYFKDAWSVFDFIVVLISWVPAMGALSVLRALRVIRVVRIIGMVPSLKQVIEGILKAVPGLGVVFSILLLVFYISAVIATNLFSHSFPLWFGDIGLSAYTLFQVMTLESWSMGIVRPIMEVHPFAWSFFIPFIFITTFTTLNLFIGVIVSAMQVVASGGVEEQDSSDVSQNISLENIYQRQEEMIKLLKAKGLD